MASSAPRGSGTVARLKRVLWPLRPILRPPWRLARRLLSRERLLWLSSVPERVRVAGAAGVRLAGWRRPDPIRPLRRYELIDLARRVPYYAPRLAYLSAAARVVGELISRRGAATALELGPHLRSLVVGADVMELEAKPGMILEGRQIIHDATTTPWPIADRAYDLFVGLQVFEHLRDRQAAAFLEVRRVARHAVISLPIDWQMPDPTNIHHRIPEERVLGWFAPVSPTRVVVGNPGPKKRLIYVFEDLPVPPAPGASVAGASEEPS